MVLGAGFGGLEVTTRLSDQFGSDVDVTLIDQADHFVFGFAKLDVMFGRAAAAEVMHAYRDIVKEGVTLVKATVQAIDAQRRRVETSAGTFDADILVVALGADLRPDLVPGLLEGGYEFYTEAGAFALQEVFKGFEGGRVVIGVTSTPFKCPPAPSETALLVDQYLTERGLRTQSEVSLVMPFGVPVPPSPDASTVLLQAFAERGIHWHGDKLVQSLDPDRNVAVMSDGSELGYDLFLGIPPHECPSVVAASELVEDGWIPVNPETLETRFPGVYAVGDVTSVGTPKAGVFSEGQATVVADAIIATIEGTVCSSTYDGRGLCYVEFGQNQVAKVDVMFRPGESPVGDIQGPSAELADDKSDFGSSRVKRWFG